MGISPTLRAGSLVTRVICDEILPKYFKQSQETPGLFYICCFVHMLSCIGNPADTQYALLLGFPDSSPVHRTRFEALRTFQYPCKG